MAADSAAAGGWSRMTSLMTALEVAMQALRVGLSPVAPMEDGSKRPFADIPDCRKFTHRESYDPDEEPANRCRCMGIRAGDHPNQAFGRGRKWCSKFDCYRRMGFIFGKPDDLIYRVEEYRAMMTMAYDDVFASVKDQANV
jgi:hypothetical protein